MEGFLENLGTISITWAAYFEDGTSLSGDVLSSSGYTPVPPSTSTESWNNVTWVAFTTGGGTVWMAGPASGIKVPAALVAAGPSATLASVTAALGTPAESALALLVNQTPDPASWTLNFLTGTPQSGSLSGNNSVSVTWTGVTWVVFDSDAGEQYMAGPASGILYAAELIAVTSNTALTDVLARTAGLPH
jgi:hypothetical protein